MPIRKNKPWDIAHEAKELRRLWGGFWSSRVLLTANNLNVFDHLAVPKTLEQAARALKADRRAAELILDALVGLGLLKKSAGVYRNAPLAARFLVKGSRYYQGDILRHAEALWQKWSDLDAIVKTGTPSVKGRDHSSFIKGMHNIAIFKAPAVIDAVNLKGVNKAMDLGGGPGTYSMEMAKRGVSVTLFDLPDTIAVAGKIIAESGLKNIDFKKGDILSDNIEGGYDLILMSQLLHAFSTKECLAITRKCVKTLNPGGRIAIHEFYIDANRTSPVPGALFSVNMLVNTDGGRCYAPAEIKKWLTDAGLKSIRASMLEDTVLVIGKK